jgi:DNA polymerase
MQHKLHIDIETYSEEPIKKTGAYKYVESDNFEILLIAYAFDDNQIEIVDLAQNEKIPDQFIKALYNPDIIKCAHNANFERICFKKYGFNIPIKHWECSSVKAAYCGLPLSLDKVSKALDLKEKGKLSTGKALIRYFCIPCKPTKVNNHRVRNFPEHDMEKWEDFKRYCINDVEAEREISKLLNRYEIPQFEKENYILDQEINDRGVRVDIDFIKRAYSVDAKFKKEVSERLIKITNIENPNSQPQLCEWLSKAFGWKIKTIAIEAINELIKIAESEAVLGVLECRKLLSKSSTKKYLSMLNSACKDERIRGMFQFYGAQRTGRWAGRIVQLQNLPRNQMRNLSAARDIIRSFDYDIVKLFYDEIPIALSELIRTALIPSTGKKFIVSDFSSIEARVLAWLAGEQWKIDVFKGHGKIYEATASLMFSTPIELISKGSDIRQKGKTSELAFGYGGKHGAIVKMDKDKKIPVNEYDKLISLWRKANPKIVKFWRDIESCAKTTLVTGETTRLNFLKFSYDGTNLMIELPSGRSLFYYKAHIGANRFGNSGILYDDLETYGGKLTENVVQAISRDVLLFAMQNLKKNGFDMVMHIHDEVVAETKNDPEKDLKKMSDIMSMNVPWAPGLPLAASGYVTEFYKKD